MIDSSGKITGYKTKVGADTVFPFSGSGSLISLSNTTGAELSLSVEKDDLILISYYHWETTVSNATLLKNTSGVNATYIRLYKATSTSVTINSQGYPCMYAIFRGVNV